MKQQSRFLTNSWITGLLSGLVSAAVVISVLFYIQTSGLLSNSDEEASRALDILDTYRCPLSDEKLVFMHDKEDDYLYEGNELSEIHPRLAATPYYQGLLGQLGRTRVYDSKEMDLPLYGYF